MPYCPQCGNATSEEQRYCPDCGENLREDTQGGQQAIQKQNPIQEDAKAKPGIEHSKLDEDEQGDYVTKERLEKIEDILYEDEYVHYLIKATALKEGFQGEFDTISGLRGWERVAITNERIVIKIPKFTGNDKRVLPYEEVTGVEVESGLGSSKLILHTDTKTYRIAGNEPSIAEFRAIEDFIKRKVRNKEHIIQKSPQRVTDPSSRIAPYTETNQESRSQGLDSAARQVNWTGRPSWWVLVEPKSIITLGIWGFFKKYSRKYKITNNLVKSNVGILSKQTSSIHTQEIRNI